MILVTGAAGKTGRAVIRALHRRGAPVRALVRSAEKVREVKAAGAVENVIGDMRSAEDLSRAAHGVGAVYHIPPNMHPDEVELGRIAISAAAAAGVEQFVYHSVLHPQVEAMPHHWRKMRVEELIFESGLPFTILQPAPYFQNILPYLPRMREEGVFALPYSADAPLSQVDLGDVGEAAANVLLDADHRGAVYELCGAEVLPPRRAAEIAGEVLGRDVQAVREPLEEWQAGARRGGLGEYALETLIRMFRYYDRYGMIGGTRVLAMLLDRPPTAFRTMLERSTR